MYISTALPGPPSTNAALPPTLAFKPVVPLPPISCLLPPLPHHRPLLLAVLLRRLPPLFQDSLRVLQWNAGCLRARSTELLHFFRPILLTSSVSRNLISTLFLFPDPWIFSLRSDRTHYWSGILFRDAAHATGGVIIFVRQGLSFFELSTSSLSSHDPYSDYRGVNISLNNSSSLSFLNVYAPPIRYSPTDGKTDSFSPTIHSSSRNLFILGDFNCYLPLWDSRGTSDPRGEEVLDWVISSDLLPPNDPYILTLFHRSSPDISFAPSSLALSCLWEVFQALGFDHLPILLSVPLSLRSFAPTSVPLLLIFRKLAGMTLLLTSILNVLLQRNTRLFLFPLLLHTSPLALNAAKSFISFGRIKRHPKAWRSAEAEDAINERRKAFAAAHRSDEDR